ncbi:MAG: VOC family protein [Firmicutes bacterium]|nr:VOC family protein [Bacillota bacterium]
MTYHSPPAVYAAQLQLNTTDLKRSVEFYTDVVGFRVLWQDENNAELTADGKGAILSLFQPTHVIPKPGKTTGLYHFALRLPQRSDLANFAVHLVQDRIRFGAADHLVSEAIYFEDPDGNGIEVYVDTDPAAWKWDSQSVSMDTLPLDFDDLLRSKGSVDQPWTGLPEDTILGHIHLHVSSLREAERFYTAGLGFEVVMRFRDSALFLSTAKYHHHIAVNTWNGVGAPRPPKHSAGLDFFTLAIPSEDRLQEVTASLERIGASVKESPSGFAVEDPAGNTIVLAVIGS